jgi:hypothetical protein
VPLADAATSPKDIVLVPGVPAAIPSGSEQDLFRVPAFFLDR